MSHPYPMQSELDAEEVVRLRLENERLRDEIWEYKKLTEAAGGIITTLRELLHRCAVGHNDEANPYIPLDLALEIDRALGQSEETKTEGK